MLTAELAELPLLC